MDPVNLNASDQGLVIDLLVSIQTCDIKKFRRVAAAFSDTTQQALIVWCRETMTGRYSSFKEDDSILDKKWARRIIVSLRPSINPALATGICLEPLVYKARHGL